MIQDLTISYVCSGIKTTFTIKDDHYDYDNMPYNLADMFSRLVKDTNANPALVIEGMKQWLEVEG